MHEQKQVDFESFKYPMFKVTTEEKKELQGCKEHSFTHLCNRVDSESLLKKIRKALKGNGVLEEYLKLEDMNTGYDFYHNGRELRDVWIDKLLAYNSK